MGKEDTLERLLAVLQGYHFRFGHNFIPSTCTNSMPVSFNGAGYGGLFYLSISMSQDRILFFLPARDTY